ncbi:MAG: RagB/SusD family nutrient uptake outer membrane protein [Prevotella sp.]|nr:RagB/SusD family nutrient uptake outer membrane protein [Prevotella sp.]
MKRNIYLSVIAALFAGFTLTACSDFMEAENKSAGGQTAEQYFNKDASSLLTAAYSSLKNYGFNLDLFSRGTDLYIHTRGKSVSDFDTYTFNTENTTVTNFYSNVYRTINLSNGVIYYAGADSQLGQEARFLRNYGYYLLTQQFGSVPYITEYINSAERSYPRTPLNEIYSAMIEDLTSLYNSSSLEAQSHIGKASKQAVAALLAKVYLAAGWDLDTSLGDAAQGTYNVNGTSNFSQAAVWAEKAINGIGLTMSFEDKWSPFNEGNAEEIFSIQYERNGYGGDIISGGHSMHGAFGGYYGAYDASGIKGASSEDCQSQKSMYLFEKGDNRYAATYMMVMYNSSFDASGKPTWGTEGYYAYYNAKEKLNTMPICKVYFPYYYTEAEVQAWIDAHQNQLIADKDKYCNSDVRISLLTLPQVTLWVYVQDNKGVAKWTKSKVSIADYNVQTSNGACVKKFDDANADFTNQANDYRDIVVFHVSDMYLIAAEAYLMAGQSAQALEKINAVRGRAGLAALSSFSAYQPEYATTGNFTIKDIDLVLDERARELYAEGHRWMDLRRTKQLVRYNVQFSEYVSDAAAMANNKGEIKWYRPIPANEISANTGISQEDQNPGY